MNALTAPERLMRQMVEDCQLSIGIRVTMRPGAKYAAEWPGEYVIVSLTWEYRNGPSINVGIASDEDIIRRHGWTDGFSLDDFDPVRP